MWDTRTGTPVGDQLTAGRTPFTDRTFGLDHFIGSRPSFSPDGRHLAAPSFDGLTTVWDLSPDHCLAAACALVGRNLTRDEWRQYVGSSGYRATCA
jgi:WD40 repeat protein